MNTMIKNETYKYALRYYEKDMNLNLKPVSILNFMQDVAAMHAEKYGFGESAVYPKNLAWFVLKYKIVLLKNINDLTDIEVETESRGVSKLFAYRDFKFYSNGELFLKASSTWALVDFETKKMVKTQDALEILPQFEKREDDLEYDKIPPVVDPVATKEFEIRFDDIDINQHVNNANYLVWALETLDFDFKCRYKLKSIDMYFKKDISYGEKVLSEVSIDAENHTTIHSLKNAQTLEELCAIKIEWK